MAIRNNGFLLYTDLEIIGNGSTLKFHIFYYNNILKANTTGEDILKHITLKRDLFLAALKKHQGPPIVATVFMNHPDRHDFVRDREAELHAVRSPRFPPPPPKFSFTSANDVFLTIEDNFKNNLFLQHDDRATVLYLKKEACGELAMEEMLQHPSPLYSEDIEIRKTSLFLDPDKPVGYACPEPCEGKYVVDFSVILPEGVMSTATVTCPYCFYYTETLLSRNIFPKLKTEIGDIINTIEYSADPIKKKCVARIPMVIVKSPGCFVGEGILGVIPLTGCPSNPSILVRTRLSFFCNDFSLFGKVIHQNDDYVLQDNV